MTPARRHACAERQRIVSGWQVCATPPGQFSSPDQLNADAGWIALSEPALAAAALRATGRWSLDGQARRFDAEDWWYRVEFNATGHDQGKAMWLGFDGLAGVANAWLNGEPLPISTNMFVASEHQINSLVRAGINTLYLRFQALDTLLAQRRPRPRWRAPMVEHQQLRWVRGTLLGRTPGWSPPAAAVGLWKDIWIEPRSGLALDALDLKASLKQGVGRVDVACSWRLPAGQRITGVTLELAQGGCVQHTSLTANTADSTTFSASAQVTHPVLWWPHTHGEPTLYSARLLVHLEDAREPHVQALDAIGFRSIEAETAEGGFLLRVNGEPVFCRGACWTPLDVVSLRATPQAYRAAVAQVRDAGMNMLRVSGTMVYEDAAFFDACDELGVLVWQEFMFANMDYPESDTEFMASVRAEAEQQLALWQARPSIAVICGNSEVEQQAAMWGAARELWQPALFHETLARWSHEALPDVPYWPSSAHGGAFPHQSDVGSSSYYGVGAYLRPTTDARLANVRFATECLAFANVPDESTIARMPGGLSMRVHHPAWKARTPRDLGAGWDFEDVRDHYLTEVFGVDVLKCRYADHDRYLSLSRAVTGELMSGAFSEWRRPRSRCGGALVLFLRDLWAGAGWGLLDETGAPKPCFFHLARALQAVSVSISDEGGNGLVAHVVNERAEVLSADLQVNLYAPSGAVVSQHKGPVQVAPRGHVSLALAEGLEHFLDLSYAYRFGPPPVVLVQVQLCTAGAVTSEAFFLPCGLAPDVPHDIGLTAVVESGAGGQAQLVVASTRFAHTVHLDLEHHAPADNYFHLAPGSQRRIALRSTSGSPVKGHITALNSDRSTTIRQLT